MAKDILSYTKKEDQASPNLKDIEPNLGLYKANLEVLGQDFARLLSENPETPVQIDKDVRVEGLKNPVYLVIIGFATQRVLASAKRSKKDIQNVLIIEPNLGIFHQTIRREWIGELISDSNTDLLVGVKPEEMLTHIYKIFTQTDKVGGSRVGRCFQPEIVVDPFAYPPTKDGKQHPVAAEITKVVIDSAKQVMLSMGCASDSYFRWEQMIRNEENLAKSYRINPLFGKFSEMPIIVVGAGPSMKEFIDAYYEYDLGSRALIIACDASLRKLLSHNIKPHIVTRCERKLTTIFDGVKKEDTSDIFYAAYPWCSPEYFDLFENSFMLFRDNGVCKWTGYGHGAVNGGVSSANAALELAYLLGGKEIILTGVDLCFLDGKSHVEGTEVEFDIEKSRSKWTEVPGNSGTVTTIPVWYRCLNEYAGTLNKYPGQAVVRNTSVNGARIPGTEVKPWSEVGPVLSSHAQPGERSPVQIIRSSLEKSGVGYEQAFKEKRTAAISELELALKDLRKLFSAVDDYLIIADREERRIINQLKSYDRPLDFFNNVINVRAALTKLFQEPSRLIDQYKFNHFTKDAMSLILLDTCQVDFFQNENKIVGLKNLQEIEHERLRIYVGQHMTLYRQIETYLQMFIGLLKNGPDQKVEYAILKDDEEEGAA